MDEITADYSVEQLIERPPLRFRPRVTVAAKTDLGRVRENNEDKFEFYLPEDEPTLAGRGQIFVVCDGMGGHAAGQIASELACKTFIEVYLNHPSEDAEAAAISAVTAANRFVFDAGRAIRAREGMGTTLSGLLLIQDRALIVQVGDSRVYRLRDGELQALTTDHTWVEEAVATNALSREEAEQHPYRHVLTRAIGTEPTVPIDSFWHDLKAGDIFMLCSDGLINHVDDLRIESILKTSSPAEATWRLVGAALMDGGSDNCTVMTVRVDEIESL